MSLPSRLNHDDEHQNNISCPRCGFHMNIQRTLGGGTATQWARIPGSITGSMKQITYHGQDEYLCSNCGRSLLIPSDINIYLK